MKTYGDVIKLLTESDKRVHVAVIYPTGRHEWLPVDKTEYLRQLNMIDKPATYEYPCLFEIEPDGEMYIHPRAENK